MQDGTGPASKIMAKQSIQKEDRKKSPPACRQLPFHEQSKKKNKKQNQQQKKRKYIDDQDLVVVSRNKKDKNKNIKQKDNNNDELLNDVDDDTLLHGLSPSLLIAEDIITPSESKLIHMFIYLYLNILTTNSCCIFF